MAARPNPPWKTMTYGDLNEKCDGRLTYMDLDWNQGCTFQSLRDDIDLKKGRYIINDLDYKPYNEQILLNYAVDIDWPYSYSFFCEFNIHIISNKSNSIPATTCTPCIGIYNNLESYIPDILTCGNNITKVGHSYTNIYPTINEIYPSINKITAIIKNEGLYKWQSYNVAGTWKMKLMEEGTVTGNLDSGQGGQASMSKIELRLIDIDSKVNFKDPENLYKLIINVVLTEM